LNGAILGMTKAEIKSKEEEIIDFSGCNLYIDTPVKRYSSGMRVRLAFAVAAHLEPDILVVDEVLAVGDAEFQKKAIGKMQDISKTDGRTVIFVSHNMAAIESLCSRVIVLVDGCSMFESKPTKAINFYLNFKDEKLKSSYQYEVFKSLTIQNKDNIVSFGENLLLSLDCKKNYDTLSIGYVIINDMEKRIGAANMSQHQATIQYEVGNTINITIKKINLKPGLYSIKLFLGNGIVDDDVIEEAATFLVVWNRDFNTPKSNWGDVHFDTVWELQK
jgi:lipopolysaccharide transport system ATP-binding protein